MVNLNGYFGEARSNVFAQHAAPIQINFLGFPGTLGAPYMDYLIADEIVIPPASREYYVEKIAYMPHSYQANDAKRIISERRFSRAELGLPEQGFVFCCFNNNFKILPNTFDSWSRVMSKVPNSVLWLLEDNVLAKEKSQSVLCFDFILLLFNYGRKECAIIVVVLWAECASGVLKLSVCIRVA